MMERTYEVPCPPFELQLSDWDKRFIPMYSKRLFCFPLPNNAPSDNARIVQCLLDALRSTVHELPFLAGSIIHYSKNQPWLRDVCAEGAAYLEVRDLCREIDYLDLRKASFASPLLNADKFCPLPEVAYVKEDSMEVCRIRANFVSGGLVLCIQIAHTVTDGRGISDIITIFTNNLRKAQKGELISDSKDAIPSKPTYSFDRMALLYGEGRGDIDKHPCWTAAPFSPQPNFTPSKNICVNFHISLDSLRALKQAASPSPSSSSADQLSYISSHDALAALIWRSLILARHRACILPASDPTVHFATAVDCRSRLSLPSPYIGNAIYGIKTSLPLSTFTSSTTNLSLQTAALIIRSSILSTTASHFRDLLAFVSRTQHEMLTRLSVLEDLSRSTIMLVSYLSFGMHELDFGPAFGKMEAFRLPSRGLVPGMPVIMPRLLDGGVEFVMNEPEGVMNELVRDNVFAGFVRRVG